MKTPVIILHGWSSDMTGARYTPLAKLLEQKGYTVYTPDLPGFGNNPLTKQAFVFDDYIQFVSEFIEKNVKQKKVILFGHSFGGRIAIRFTAENKGVVEKLILADASGIPQTLSFKKKLLSLAATLVKPVFGIPPFSLMYGVFRKMLYKGIGEMDYYKSGKLADTFKNVYRVSIVSDLPHIHIPTLILWGSRDTFTPLRDGRLMHEGIKGSKFAIIQDATHRLPYENPTATAREIISFLT